MIAALTTDQRNLITVAQASGITVFTDARYPEIPICIRCAVAEVALAGVVSEA